MFSTDFKNIGYSFTKKNIFLKIASRWTRWQTWCEIAVAIATVIT